MQHQNNQEVSPLAESIHKMNYIVDMTDTPEAVRLAPSIHEMNYRAAMTALENVKAELEKVRGEVYAYDVQEPNGNSSLAYAAWFHKYGNPLPEGAIPLYAAPTPPEQQQGEPT